MQSDAVPAWLGLAGIIIGAVPAWLGLVGIVMGAVLALCSLDFVGPFKRDGWKVAAALTPIISVPGRRDSWHRAWQCCCDRFAHLLFHCGNPRETLACL